MSKVQKTITETPPKTELKRGKRPGIALFPRYSLKDSLVIPQVIWRENGGNSFNILDLAPATNWSPNSSGFVKLLASSYRYGLTEGSPQTKVITLTQLGMSTVAPTSESDQNAAYKKALMHNPLLNKVYSYYNGKPLPRPEILKNILIRSIETGGFGITREDVDSFIKIFMKNIAELNLGQDINGTTYLRLDKLGSQLESPKQEDLPDIEIDDRLDLTNSTSTPPMQEIPQKETPKQIFAAHGKNTKPLEQLKTILDQFQVPYKVAIDEPHEGRPISNKVSDLMRDCSSAIFIFTKDEETKDMDGNTVFRPSDNVVYELGAASVLYGKKIVIFKENGVSFGSDFKDLGYISFDSDQLNAKSMDLMKELVRFGLLKVSAA